LISPSSEREGGPFLHCNIGEEQREDRQVRPLMPYIRLSGGKGGGRGTHHYWCEGGGGKFKITSRREEFGGKEPFPSLGERPREKRGGTTSVPGGVVFGFGKKKKQGVGNLIWETCQRDKRPPEVDRSPV